MSRKPAITSLLNGQAVNVLVGSTSVTLVLGASRLSARAQVPPANPPPTTTTRGAACAIAGSGRSVAPVAATLPLRNLRRVLLVIAPRLLFLLREVRRDRRGFALVEPLGDAVHHG